MQPQKPSLIDSRMVAEILKAWTSAAGVEGAGDLRLSIPEPEDLGVLLDTVFLASVLKEEGRNISVRLLFFPRGMPQWPKDWSDSARWIRFDGPVPLSVDQLKKLSPAFDHRLAAPTVEKRGEALFITGALFYGRGPDWFARGQQLWRLAVPMVALDSRRPGSVAVGTFDSAIGYLENGAFHQADAGPMGSPAFVSHLLQLIAEHDGYRKFGNAYWLVYRESLARIYSLIADRRHGGTLILLPGKLKETAERFLQVGIKADDSSTGADRILERVFYERAQDDEHRIHHLNTADRRLVDHLDFLTQLALVDGALVVDDRLAALRFGAQLAAPDTDWPVLRELVILPQPRTVPFEMGHLGSRHQSARKFVAACPGSVAFVISEDGPVRALLAFPDQILIWPDCLQTGFMR